ncbi:hypothetical protein [Methylocella sp. CPCC 101449]|uniref:hypothetical protein n=1 Tax=Methylocella sp. CPCC 101449 TaxID=2987531 RepID=UPI00288E0E7B|nr:hypothetical protein [Methylocella sp. CPCC 101449]MDT2023536.1 tripartite tricarboxylate transporter substrate-binding protein [Methylocella sp. CPCC 101449]
MRGFWPGILLPSWRAPWRVLALILIPLILQALPLSRASAADPFYKGKTITLIAGFGAGGGIDSTARVMQRHLWRFLPGWPEIIIQSMEGAGGVVAANYLEKRVPPDGLTLALPGRSWFVEGLVKSPGVTFDPTRFSFIGSSGVTPAFLFVRADSGIKTFEDLKRSTKPLPLAAIAAGTSTAMVPRLLAQIGIPVEAVLGYGSTARMLIAVESGEATGFFLSEDSVTRRADLQRKGVIIPLLQTRPVIAGLPLLQDVVPPSHQDLLALTIALDSFGLMLVGPPGIPAEQMASLREAFMAMTDDREFLGDMARADLSPGEALSGETIETAIKALAERITPELIAHYRDLGGRKER